MKPHEMRARAKQLRDQAQQIYDAKKGDGAPDFTAEELQRYDALLAEAEGLLTKAAEAEAREKRFNDLDARLGQNPPRVSGPLPPGERLPHNDPGNTRNGRHGYSLLKALYQASESRQGRGGGLDGLELEVHQELFKRRGNRVTLGILVPWDLPVDVRAARRHARASGMERRDLTTTSGAGAVYEVVSTTMIELLRSMTLVDTLGVRILNDMNGNFSIPKQTGTGAAYWVTEGNAPTESGQSIGSVDFAPKTVGAFSDYSRKFLMQTSVDAEMFLREDLAAVMALELDRVTFAGSGVGAEPEGMLAKIVGSYVIALGANGGDPTWKAITDMEKVVDVANALMGDLSLVTTPAARSKMRNVTRVANSQVGDFLWADDGTVNSYSAYRTNQVPSNLTKGTGTGLSAAIFGNWRDCIWAFWSGLDVMVNPYSPGAEAGNVRVIELQDADFNVRHIESFSAIKDMTTV